MAGALVIPGVQVRTEFEPSPALPGATGILGVVGIADRGPIDPTPIGSFAEFIDIFGPASRFSMPEVRTALANGVFQAVVARIEPGVGQKAAVNLLDDEGEPVVRLVARAEGSWGNQIAVRVTQVRTLTGAGIKYVNLELLVRGDVVERHDNLVMDPTSPNYLFERINADSALVTAVDPVFETGLPSAIGRTLLENAEPRKAFAVLSAGPAEVLRVESKRAGRAGNQNAVLIRDGRASLRLVAGDQSSVLIRAREAGAEGTGNRITVQTAAPGSVTIVVSPASGAARSITAATVDEIVSGLAGDPDVEAVAQGTVLPAERAASPLERTVTVEIHSEGRDPAIHLDMASLEEIGGISNSLVDLLPVEGATQLPDANDGVPLESGRSRGPALALVGGSSEEPLLELVPAPRVTAGLEVQVASAVSTIDGSTAVVNLEVFADDERVETFSDLTMDPDDPNYLPHLLAEASAFLRAFDLFVRSRTTSLPRALARAVPLTQGSSPGTDDYVGALERLESAEEVDLVIASVTDQLEDADIRTVHQAVAAHCTKMAEPARNRIGLGSVTRSETASPAAILDHANDVRSDHFVLVAPADGDAGVAGLLGRQDYFKSPTFKTIALLNAPPGTYTDSQLTQLVSGNVLVVNKRRKRGIIVIKGVLTSGRQINVQRTVNKAVRDIKALADNYIGLLNNEGTRNALKQQAFALLAQMERDGALVPSTDGSDPAFKVDVLATQDDFAKGIVRIDVALRPVRAIDFIYTTIFVQN